jgi:RNA polymerase sigma-70 factor (ECF subfamily)
MPQTGARVHGAPDDARTRSTGAQIEELMAAHGDAIYSLCLRVLRERTRAQDVLQQVFIEAHRDLPRFEARAPVRSWLFAIAMNRCKDALRADRRWARRFDVNDDAVAAAEDPANHAGAQFERRQMIADLERCLATLSSDARLAVLLRFQERMSYEEMGAWLHTKADTLQTRVTRAMPVLRRCLERRGWDHA